ncbi:MAG TPA: hypothetical protein VIT42_11945 [Microlunatus sp.]
MSADLSAPRAQTGSDDRVGTLGRRTALDRQPAVLPARPVPVSARPRRRPAASLLRLRRYLHSYRWRFLLMILLASIGLGATIVIPLVTKAVIDARSRIPIRLG